MGSKRELLEVLERVYAEIGEILGYEPPDDEGDEIEEAE